MTTLFLDTGAILAEVLPRDRNAKAARHVFDAISAGHWREVYTSDQVVAEALDFVGRKVPLVEVADAVVDRVFGTADVAPSVSHVVRVHGGRFAAALDLYRSRFDQGLSFTDWTTVVAMEELGIDELATFDQGFRGIVDVVPR